MLKSYSSYVNNTQNIDLIISNIKDTIAKKLVLLINILFKEDKKAWDSVLNITTTDSDISKHYEQLIKIIKFMVNIQNLNEIPVSLIENFSQNLLLTPELNIEINKLILNNFK